MKSYVGVILSICLLLGLSTHQKPQWKGIIAEKDGIKFIKNPNEPLYGETTFELEEDLSIGKEEDDNYCFFKIRDIQVDNDGNIYVLDGGNYRIQKFNKNGDHLLTIGKRGEGPGEFKAPRNLQIDNDAGILFVNDELRKVKVFNKDGDYLDEDIALKESLSDFFIDSDGNIWGKFVSPGYHTLKILDREGNVKNQLIEFPFDYHSITLEETKSGNTAYRRSIFATHGYEYDVYISKINDQMFTFGNSKEYELNIVDNEGNTLFVVQKDETHSEFSGKEKDEFERSLRNDAASKGYRIPRITTKFPDYMPFFYSIFADCQGRIYLQKNQSDRQAQGKRIYDIFSRDGYYLYRAATPVHPYVIKNDHLYTRVVNGDSGEEFVKRYKIKNWDQIKEGID